MLRDEQETSVKVEYTGRTGNSRAMHGEMGVGGGCIVSFIISVSDRQPVWKRK